MDHSFFSSFLNYEENDTTYFIHNKNMIVALFRGRIPFVFHFHSMNSYTYSYFIFQYEYVLNSDNEI